MSSIQTGKPLEFEQRVQSDGRWVWMRGPRLPAPRRSRAASSAGTAAQSPSTNANMPSMSSAAVKPGCAPSLRPHPSPWPSSNPEADRVLSSTPRMQQLIGFALHTRRGLVAQLRPRLRLATEIAFPAPRRRSPAAFAPARPSKRRRPPHPSRRRPLSLGPPHSRPGCPRERHPVGRGRHRSRHRWPPPPVPEMPELSQILKSLGSRRTPAPLAASARLASHID